MAGRLVVQIQRCGDHQCSRQLGGGGLTGSQTQEKGYCVGRFLKRKEGGREREGEAEREREGGREGGRREEGEGGREGGGRGREEGEGGRREREGEK